MTRIVDSFSREAHVTEDNELKVYLTQESITAGNIVLVDGVDDELKATVSDNALHTKLTGSLTSTSRIYRAGNLALSTTEVLLSKTGEVILHNLQISYSADTDELYVQMFFGASQDQAPNQIGPLGVALTNPARFTPTKLVDSPLFEVVQNDGSKKIIRLREELRTVGLKINLINSSVSTAYNIAVSGLYSEV